MNYKILDDKNNIYNLNIKEIIYLIKKDSTKKFFKFINNKKIEINNKIVCETQFICHRINTLNELKQIDKQFYMNDNGDGEIYANGTINTSDKNLKKNINPTELGLDFINQLNPVTYEWKNKKDNKKSHGLIAQEVEETMNNLNMSKNEYSLINYDESNNKYGINYSELIGPLIKAIQELSNENKILKEKILNLEKKYI